MEYSPLATGHGETILDITSSDLGTITYVFKLSAKPPIPEQPVHFKTTLGHSTERKLFLTNTSDHRVDLIAKVKLFEIVHFEF